jgi:glycosyltransferase involved in cell wall biosynthesis
MNTKVISALIIQYNNPSAFPPVIHICEILTRSGVTVHLFGVEGKDTIGLTMPGQVAASTKILRQPNSRIVLPWFWLYFNLVAVLKAMWIRPAIVHVSDYTACLAGLVISWTTRAQVIYHEHDSPEEGGGRKNRMLLRLRRFLARNCDVCILPNEERARAFERQTQMVKPAAIVWNCPTKEEIDSIVPRGIKDNPDASLRVGYAGTINEVRVPKNLIHALAKCPEAHLTLVGYETVGSRGYVKSLKELAEKLGVGDKFRYAGPQPQRSDVFRELQANDVCLGLMPMEGGDINTRAMVGASNKAFDAFACGLPIVVSDLDDWKTAYVQSGVALACDPRDADSIARVFEWYRMHPAERQQMGMKARRLVEQQWNYEVQFAPVLKMLGLSSAAE